MTRWAVLAPLLMCFGGVRTAAAHAPPKATSIHWQANGREAIVQTNRGLIVESAAQSSFRILCNEAYRSSVVEGPPVVVAPDGRVLAGTYAAGVVRSTPDRCTFDPVAGPMAGLNTVDLQIDPGSAARFYSLTLPADGSDARLWKTDDAGLEWQGLATVAGAATSLRIARGPETRIYVLSTRQDGENLFADVFTSPNGADMLLSGSHGLESGEVRAYLLDVAPADSARLFARTETFDGITPERLLRTSDGGATFTTVLRAAGPLTMATTPDGQTIWVGGAEGIWRSTDQGETFARLSERPVPTRVSCLSVHLGKLYACGDFDGRPGVYAAREEGGPFATFLHFTDVRGRVDCGPSTSEATGCSGPFADWSVEQPYQASAAAVDTDGVTPPSTVDQRNGCAVATPAQARGVHLSGEGIAGLLTLLACRRRRCRSRAKITR